MEAATDIASSPVNGLSKVPPLQNGDRLNRPEFERRFEAMPQLKKAELINGVVYMAAAVRFVQHGGPHFDFIGWLWSYRMATQGVRGGDNSSLRLDLKNELQPDAFLIVLPSHGGQAQIDPDGYITGSPKLIGEITASTASYDLHDKLVVYRQNGVKEYIVWRVYDQAIDWFRLREGRFEPLPLTADGIYRSEVFPGLWLDPAALINGDMVAVARVLQQGLATPEHAAFVVRLQQAATRNQ